MVAIVVSSFLFSNNKKSQEPPTAGTLPVMDGSWLNGLCGHCKITALGSSYDMNRQQQTYGLCKYDFSTISAVTTELAHSFPCVCLTVSNGGKSTLYVATKDVEKMVDYIKSEILPSAATATISPADEIMKYKRLFDCGAITAEEFDAKKKQLLGL